MNITPCTTHGTHTLQTTHSSAETKYETVLEVMTQILLHGTLVSTCQELMSLISSITLRDKVFNSSFVGENTKFY